MSAVAGSGVTGDLLAHNIDTALWLNGPITEVTAMTETFVKERKHNLTGKVEPVGIDDASAFLCRFENGSLAMFEATRYARGHKALYTLEINGEHASAFWDLHDLHRIQYFDHRDEGRVRGWRNVHVTDGDQPYMKHWWVPGLQIGYEHTFIHQFADFVAGGSQRQEPRADVPRRARDRLRHRRRAQVGEDRQVGEGLDMRCVAMPVLAGMVVLVSTATHPSAPQQPAGRTAAGWRARRAGARARTWRRRVSSARSDRLPGARGLDVALRRQDAERLVGR